MVCGVHALIDHYCKLLTTHWANVETVLVGPLHLSKHSWQHWYRSVVNAASSIQHAQPGYVNQSYEAIGDRACIMMGVG